MTPIVKLGSVSRHFEVGQRRVTACSNVSFELNPGQLLVVGGRSGSGKTTLLNLIGTLDRPSAGTLDIDGMDTTLMPEAERTRIRRESIGFVFQRFALLPALTAAENVELPLRLIGMTRHRRLERVDRMLDRVGLAKQRDQFPDELSGGQMQRLSLARALVRKPRLLLADEPTGQLDAETASVVMNLISELVHEGDVAGIVTTHDPAFFERADLAGRLHDGQFEWIAPAI